MEKTMKARYTITLSILAGIAIGAFAIQSLYAQGRQLIYFIAEKDVADPEGYKTEYLPAAQASIKAHGGRYLAGGTATAFAGEPPKSRVVIHVWDSMEQLQGWFNSQEYKEARKIGEKYAKFRNFAIPGVPQ
jgi:uncharacterized protein (DUF1330 family)